MPSLKEILFKLIRFKSETRNQPEVHSALRYIASLFRSTHYISKEFKKEGVYSLLVYPRRSNWKRPNVLLSGHVDVVPAKEAIQYRPFQKGNKVFGRGASDMKGGLTSLIGSLLESETHENKSNAALLVTGDEEVGGMHGTGYLVEEIGLRPEFVLVGDGPRRDRLAITTKEKGGIWLEIVARGKSAHAARPWLGENALDKLNEAIRTVKKLIGEKVKPEAWKTTATLSIVETDNATPNVIPAYARGVLDIRFTEDFAKTPREALKKIQKAIPDVEVSSLTNVAPLLNDEKDERIRNFQKEFSRVAGKKVPLVYGHAASDGRYFSAHGIPSILAGTVGDKWHSVEEWVDWETVVILKNAVVGFLTRCN